jgi:hypothetical protein
VAKPAELSVFEHLAKYAPDPVAKTNPPLGQARRNKTRNSLELNELWIRLRALAQDLPLFSGSDEFRRPQTQCV